MKKMATRCWCRLCLFLILIVSTSAGQHVYGHEARPIYIDISEMSPATFQVRWRMPPSVPYSNLPIIAFPKNCVVKGSDGGDLLGKTYEGRRGIFCENELSGKTISVEFPFHNPSVTTLFRLKRISGETQTKLLPPRENHWRVPVHETWWGVGKQYLVLGIKHILEGYDHLLFLACLLFIAGTGRRILITVTGFTIAHSFTLALAALGIVKVPIPPVEAVIALSIVFLATEIARNRQDTLTWRYPIAVSASFGLLHGFGFAAVLSDIGLPQVEIPSALLFFNIGVEIGQLMCVVGAFLLVFGFRRLRLLQPIDSNYYVRIPIAYVVGILSTFWMVQRLAGFVA